MVEAQAPPLVTDMPKPQRILGTAEGLFPGAKVQDFSKFIAIPEALEGRRRVAHLTPEGKLAIRELVHERIGVDKLGYADIEAAKNLVGELKTHYSGTKSKKRTEEQKFHALAARSLEMQMRHAQEIDTREALRVSNSPWHQVVDEMHRQLPYTKLHRSFVEQIVAPVASKLYNQVKEATSDPLIQDLIFDRLAQTFTAGLPKFEAQPEVTGVDEKPKVKVAQRANKLAIVALGGEVPQTESTVGSVLAQQIKTAVGKAKLETEAFLEQKRIDELKQRLAAEATPDTIQSDMKSEIHSLEKQTDNAQARANLVSLQEVVAEGERVQEVVLTEMKKIHSESDLAAALVRVYQVKGATELEGITLLLEEKWLPENLRMRYEQKMKILTREKGVARQGFIGKVLRGLTSLESKVKTVPGRVKPHHVTQAAGLFSSAYERFLGWKANDQKQTRLRNQAFGVVQAIMTLGTAGQGVLQKLAEGPPALDILAPHQIPLQATLSGNFIGVTAWVENVPTDVKQSLKDAILNNSDPNIRAAAALFDEQHGLDKVETGTKLAWNLVTGTSGKSILGDFAIDDTVPTSNDFTVIVPQSTVTPTATAEFVHQQIPLALVSEFDQVQSTNTAREFVKDMSLNYLVIEPMIDSATDTRVIRFQLPDELKNKQGTQYLLELFGQQSQTIFGEALPEGVVATINYFPQNAVAAVGPFGMTQEPSFTKLAYGVSTGDAYAQNHYPEHMLAEIWIQNSIKSGAFRPTDRIVPYQFVGSELASGAVRNGALYLAVDDHGSWKMAEYPNVADTGSIVNLMFSFNQVNPGTGQREFGVPNNLISSQVARAILEGADFRTDSAGPSPIFRYDSTTGQKDIVTISPFLYIYAPQMFRELILNTPFADGSLPNPDTTFVGAGDLAFASRNTDVGLLGKGALSSLPTTGATSNDVKSVRNHTGFYIGISDDSLKTVVANQQVP